MKHHYSQTCQCYRCKEIRNRPTFSARQVRAQKKFVLRVASREEQHARCIDCGPQNWDDRESSSGDY